jgi:hypothetical protein
MATSTEEVENVQDLEDGELPSSDSEMEEMETDKTQKNNDDKDASESSNENDDMQRKRPFETAESDKQDGRHANKKLKLDEEKERERDGSEEGEIFSDDEEAAYYPQLVKKRISPSIKDRSSSPFHDDHPPFYHEDRHGNQDDSRNKYGRFHSSPTKNQRWRNKPPRSKNHSGNSDLIGPPIRHDRVMGTPTERKWEEPHRGVGGAPTLTLELIENRLSRHLALLPTPKINQCLSLDEMNYPAPPQWYLKAVSIYNKKLMSKIKDVDSKQHDVLNNLGVAVGYQHLEEVEPVAMQPTPVAMQPAPVAKQPLPVAVETIQPLFTPTEQVVTIGPSMIDDKSFGSPLPPPSETPPSSIEAPPVLSITSTTDRTHSSSDEFPLGREMTRSTRKTSRRKTKNHYKKFTKKSTISLIVSIDLSLINAPGVTDDYNYDDYLNQLNDEEGSNDDASTTSYDFRSAAADFWIDTKPAAIDPLDFDFTTTDMNSASRRDKMESSLKSLVGQQSIDDSIALEEGKDISKGKKSLSSLKIPRKKKSKKREDKVTDEVPSQAAVAQPNTLPDTNAVKTFEAVKSTNVNDQQMSSQVIDRPCKYFLNGNCIHGDMCQYSHSVKREKKKEMCKFYLQDACDKGDDCLYFHGSYPCKYFHTRHMCYHGDKCKFSHSPLNHESYEILMNAVDPGMKEFVTYPPPPLPPPHHHHEAPPSILGPAPMPPPPPAQILIPSSHMSPPPSLLIQATPYPPPHQQATPYPPPSQQATPYPLPSQQATPYPPPPRHDPNWYPSPNPAHIPPPTNEGIPIINNTNEEHNTRRTTPNIDVSVLFPEPHPQVLPHELASQLRKVLLPTPAGSTDVQPSEEELEYWESEDIHKTMVESLPPLTSVPVVTGSPVANMMYEEIPRPLMPHPPVPMATNEPGRRVFRPPGGNIPPHVGPPGPPREHFMHDKPRPDIRPAVPHPHMIPPGRGPYDHAHQPAIDPRHSRQHNSSKQTVLRSPTDNSTLSATTSTTSYTTVSTTNSTSSSTIATASNKGTYWGSNDVKNDERLVDPRHKYSHLRIKSKNQESINSPKNVDDYSSNNSSLPPLLQNKSLLKKPLAPQELFGTSNDAGSITLFGSRQQVPDSPLPKEKVTFGEIKMADDSGDKETPVPSYLSHLDLGLDQEDESELQIESAFGALQRRASEMSSSLSEDTSSQQDVVTPPAAKDPPIGKIFTFGSSIFNNN